MGRKESMRSRWDEEKQISGKGRTSCRSSLKESAETRRWAELVIDEGAVGDWNGGSGWHGFRETEPAELGEHGWIIITSGYISYL